MLFTSFFLSTKAVYKIPLSSEETFVTSNALLIACFSQNGNYSYVLNLEVHMPLADEGGRGWGVEGVALK